MFFQGALWLFFVFFEAATLPQAKEVEKTAERRLEENRYV